MAFILGILPRFSKWVWAGLAVLALIAYLRMDAFSDAERMCDARIAAQIATSLSAQQDKNSAAARANEERFLEALRGKETRRGLSDEIQREITREGLSCPIPDSVASKLRAIDP